MRHAITSRPDTTGRRREATAPRRRSLLGSASSSVFDIMSSRPTFHSSPFHSIRFYSIPFQPDRSALGHGGLGVAWLWLWLGGGGGTPLPRAGGGGGTRAGRRPRWSGGRARASGGSEEVGEGGGTLLQRRSAERRASERTRARASESARTTAAARLAVVHVFEVGDGERLERLARHCVLAEAAGGAAAAARRRAPDVRVPVFRVVPLRTCAR